MNAADQAFASYHPMTRRGWRTTKQQEYRHKRPSPTDIFSFLIGVSGFIELKLVGTLFAPDVVLLGVFFYLLPKRGARLTDKWPARILIFALIWLASQILTDIYRASQPEDYLRGWAKITFLMTNFAALYLLLRTDTRVIGYVAGIATGLIVKYFVNPLEAAADDPWKWAFAVPTTTLLVLLATLNWDRRKRILACGFLCIGCGINLYFNFRSMALFSFVTACGLMLAARNTSRRHATKVMATLVVIAFGVWIFGQLYSELAASGALGTDALDKYEAQSAGDLGMLIGGRSESLASLKAIKDSPLLGHGSWARDSYYVEMLKSAAIEHGYKLPYIVDDLIPSHSHILGAWVEAGVAGALFWSIVLIVASRGIVSFLSTPLPLSGLGLFCGSLVIWDIFFSPFGASGKFVTPAYIVILIEATRRANNQRSTGDRKQFAHLRRKLAQI